MIQPKRRPLNSTISHTNRTKHLRRRPCSPPALAQQIASETTEAIGHNVIITDAEAIVIGSGDEARSGTLHEASFEVLESQQSAWHTPY